MKPIRISGGCGPRCPNHNGREMSMKPKRDYSNFILVLIFFIGLSVLLYPTVSDYWNSKVQSRAIVDYEAMLKDLTPEDYTAVFAQADQYNEQIRNIAYPLMYHDQVPGYEETLNVTGNGIMGYITIPKIQVELPVYHGTGEAVLNVASGHVQGTSLPVGGESTHAVLSAHRGLPSARLFTDLDKLEVGDVFTITVLDRLLTYQIDKIQIVRPNEVDALYVTEGEDYCTLVTCTPYGINTHRLLVRGTRVETPEVKNIYITTDAYRIDSLILTPVVAAPMLLVLLIILLVRHPKKKQK